jgi:hypothetical protein
LKNKALYLVFTIILLFAIIIISAFEVHAQEVLFWSDNAYSVTGATVSTPTLVSGTEYRIVVSYRFWYNADADAMVQADAQYYTNATAQYDLTNWDNHYPAPNGHSFLQINGTDVNWGAFSNGDANHTYSIAYTGQNASISFQIVDWMDQDYTNNNCHINISIYEQQPTSTATPTPTLVPTSTPTPNPTSTPKPAPTATPTITPAPTPIPTTISSPTAPPTTSPLPLSISIQPISSMTIAYLLVLAIYALDIVLILIILAILLTEKIKKKQNPT